MIKLFFLFFFFFQHVQLIINIYDCHMWLAMCLSIYTYICTYIYVYHVVVDVSFVPFVVILFDDSPRLHSVRKGLWHILFFTCFPFPSQLSLHMYLYVYIFIFSTNVYIYTHTYNTYFSLPILAWLPPTSSMPFFFYFIHCTVVFFICHFFYFFFIFTLVFLLSQCDNFIF